MDKVIIDPLGEAVKTEKLARCQEHQDCFSCVDGYCTALHPKFVGTGCVFYKNRERSRAENKAIFERLWASRRSDLVSTYAGVYAAMGVFDEELEKMERMAAEMEAFRKKNLGEMMAASGSDGPTDCLGAEVASGEAVMEL